MLDAKSMEWSFCWKGQVLVMGLCLGFVTGLQELCETTGGGPEGKKQDCPCLENMRWGQRLPAFHREERVLHYKAMERQVRQAYVR